jgi:hypothetical protein
MAHEEDCRDVLRWIEPIKEQVEECVEHDCYWLCLCCNKWICGLVWVTIVAGRYVTEQVCEAVTHAAEGVAAGIREGFRLLGGFLGIFISPEDINKTLGMHIIVDSAKEGGLSKNHSIPLVGGNCAKKHASAFNNSNVADLRYIDSGVRYSYRINANDEVLVRVDGETERLVQHTNDQESEGTPLENQSGQLGIHFVNRREGHVLRDLKFDLIAASGNRVFVREKDTANFYFASMKHEFINRGPAGLDQTPRGAVVPGVYATLDAEHGDDFFDTAPNPAADDYARYGRHPSLKAFKSFSDYGLIAERIYEGLLIVKVFPEVWHRLDTRPPYDSGSPPWFVDTFDHVTYEGAFGVKKTYKSIKIHGVLDVGVGHTHRVLHYETKYGDEVDTMNKVAYPEIAGPIEDGGGFCDGMCNFYVLCKIKVRSITNVFAPPDKETYAILWIDEQTYFCERWRLVGFEDGDCNTLRAWGIAGVYSAHNAKSPLYWSPFETSWWNDPSHITDSSRLAVAKHTLVVNGVGPVSTLHPDNTDETAPSVSVFSPVLYSTNYSFATSDKTWRWRGYPCPVASGCEWAVTATGPTCYPETVKIREDMTIYLKGENADGVRGYWYQKYLPADNTPVRHANMGMPHYSYIHGWSFAEQNVFEAADKYSHFGVHRMNVDSRSQFYLLDIVDKDGLPADFEDLPWRDEEDRLFWFHVSGTNPAPSPYNHGSFFRIMDRRPLGFIAVWWDKRDDELPGLNRIGGDIELTQRGGRCQYLHENVHPPPEAESAGSAMRQGVGQGSRGSRQRVQLAVLYPDVRQLGLGVTDTRRAKRRPGLELRRGGLWYPRLRRRSHPRLSTARRRSHVAAHVQARHYNIQGAYHGGVPVEQRDRGNDLR